MKANGRIEILPGDVSSFLIRQFITLTQKYDLRGRKLKADLVAPARFCHINILLFHIGTSLLRIFSLENRILRAVTVTRGIFKDATR